MYSRAERQEREAQRSAERAVAGWSPPKAAAADSAAAVLDDLGSVLGHQFSQVRLHADDPATQAARRLDVPAFTVGHDIAFGSGQYAPHTRAGRYLLAHELAHVVQQRGSTPRLQCYGDPIPDVANPTVRTMREYIDLIRRYEAANPSLTALQAAQRIMRTKYHSQGFDWLLPTTAGAAGGRAGGGVTPDDVTTLTGEFDVLLPQGGLMDASHVVTAIVAAAELQAPGAGGAGGLSGRIVSGPPAGLTQLDIASWAGDPGSAAAEWMTAHPHPRGGTTMQAYLDEFSPESDMMGDVDGVAMTSMSPSAGFVFDPARPLSDNLERFYFPTAPREGKNRRFHLFCSVLGLALEPDGVTLSPSAVTTIDIRVSSSPTGPRSTTPTSSPGRPSTPRRPARAAAIVSAPVQTCRCCSTWCCSYGLHEPTTGGGSRRSFATSSSAT